MIVRPASLLDLSALVAYGKEAHARSNYVTDAPFNAVMTRQYFKGAIEARDHVLLVALDNAKRVRGLLAGHSACHVFSHTTFATDVLFVADQGGDQLLDGFVAWARRMGAKLIESAPSQSDRYDVLCKLYERKGFVRHGGTFRLNLREVAA